MQKMVTGQTGCFRMLRVRPEWPGQLIHPGLYLHVPFCKKPCPYCPYNRIEYNDKLFSLYERAVKQEIDLYAPYLQGQTFSSLYIGGGTPTVNWPGLLSIIAHLKQRIGRIADICVELHPSDMDLDCLSALRDAGVNMLSIGVESTSDVLLKKIRRRHDSSTAIASISRAQNIGFKSVNADLMFALPGQDLDQWKLDVTTLIDLGIDQLSTYPLFSFSYSDLGRQQGIDHVEKPAHRAIIRMLAFTDEYCERKGLQRCSVWSWLKPGKEKFSSVSRHHYIGFGPSAASMTGSDFYVNTFDVNAYANTLPEVRPIAVSMPVNRRLEMAYWLYWRIYELKISAVDFCGVFGDNASLGRHFGHLLYPLVALRLLERVDGYFRVTKAGAYWIHRLQNEYTLNYINRLWGACRREPWPEFVEL